MFIGVNVSFKSHPIFFDDFHAFGVLFNMLDSVLDSPPLQNPETADLYTIENEMTIAWHSYAILSPTITHQPHGPESLSGCHVSAAQRACT